MDIKPGLVSRELLLNHSFSVNIGFREDWNPKSVDWYINESLIKNKKGYGIFDKVPKANMAVLGVLIFQEEVSQSSCIT